MKVYVAVLTYIVEGYEKFHHMEVVGTFKARVDAERALDRECEFIESNPMYMVTGGAISEQWIE